MAPILMSEVTQSFVASPNIVCLITLSRANMPLTVACSSVVCAAYAGRCRLYTTSCRTFCIYDIGQISAATGPLRLHDSFHDSLGHANTPLIVSCPTEARAANRGGHHLSTTPVSYTTNYDTRIEYSITVKKMSHTRKLLYGSILASWGDGQGRSSQSAGRWSCIHPALIPCFGLLLLVLRCVLGAPTVTLRQCNINGSNYELYPHVDCFYLRPQRYKENRPICANVYSEQLQCFIFVRFFASIDLGMPILEPI